MRRELQLPPRQTPRRTRSATFALDATDPRHQSYREAAAELRRAHPDWFERPRTRDGGVIPTPADVEIEVAVLYQIRDRVRRGLIVPSTHDAKLRLLEDFDAHARNAGMPTLWTNTMRGSLSEFLFTPEGAQRPVSLQHPVRGRSHPDYAYQPGAGPLSTGRREYVEQKSDLITATGTERSSAAVGTARDYVADAILDRPAIERANGDHLIEFVRRPGNPANEQAMLAVLFADDSPFEAVKFADGQWVRRQDCRSANTAEAVGANQTRLRNGLALLGLTAPPPPGTYRPGTPAPVPVGAGQ
jgi:hypothetical protein